MITEDDRKFVERDRSGRLKKNKKKPTHATDQMTLGQGQEIHLNRTQELCGRIAGGALSPKISSNGTGSLFCVCCRECDEDLTVRLVALVYTFDAVRTKQQPHNDRYQKISLAYSECMTRRLKLIASLQVESGRCGDDPFGTSLRSAGNTRAPTKYYGTASFPVEVRRCRISSAEFLVAGSPSLTEIDKNCCCLFAVCSRS
ncbi:hypothetical protein GWI33_010437 [Rhynchophorus ferrugineus]|uniref:Uncharacterized protein n=1 Tax=Rhynchophorus ferrugineus TaxID=354439 RepID=A0A834MC96_RHYFE|nr:hypothetical protein GWI33_010437 [Rhynchophorus ferrugineus]